jgi:competence protein ComGC
MAQSSQRYHFQAFTFVELLVTTVVFVVVLMFSVSIFTSTVLLSQQAGRQAGVAAQARQALDIIDKSYLYSTSNGANVVKLLNGGIALVYAVERPNSAGGRTGAYDTYAYCVVNHEGRGMLARYRVGQDIPLLANVNPASCSGVQMGSLFGIASMEGPDYLTDSSTDVLSFESSVLHYDDAVQSPSVGLRLGITVIHADQDRATGIKRSPITARTVSVRRLPSEGVYFNELQ